MQACQSCVRLHNKLVAAETSCNNGTVSRRKNGHTVFWLMLKGPPSENRARCPQKERRAGVQRVVGNEACLVTTFDSDNFLALNQSFEGKFEDATFTDPVGPI